MPEFTPIIQDGRILGKALSSFDFLYVIKSSSEDFYLWYTDVGVKITDIVRDWTLSIGDFTINLKEWLDPIEAPYLYAAPDVEEYVKKIAEELKRLEGKRILLSFSGGKDSTVALYILLRLQEYIRYELFVVYSHFPILEPEVNLKHAEKVAEKLGVELIVTGPPKRILEKYLYKEGLPYRGSRWCTYLKTRPIREVKRKLKADIDATGDRAFEAGKRMRKSVKSGSVVRISGKEVRPIADMTILDVIRIARDIAPIHPCYLKGCTRVACTYCPYKSLYEIHLSDKTGFEGLIEEILKQEWRRWYKSKDIPFEDFVEHHLWRYKPYVAKKLLELKESIKEKGTEKIGIDEVTKAFSSPWTEKLPPPSNSTKNLNE